MSKIVLHCLVNLLMTLKTHLSIKQFLQEDYIGSEI